MTKQKEIIESGPLLDEDGSLLKTGWAKKPLLIYNKENIGKSWLRIKEWDHYSILNKDFGFQLTIGDIGYLTQMSFVWLDFKKKKRYDHSTMKFFTKSKILPLSSTKDSLIIFPTQKFNATMEKEGRNRILTIDDENFMNLGIKGTIKLDDKLDWDNTVVATGYKESPKKFYYNHKINMMPAEGIIYIGEKSYQFEPNSSFGLMDWGRGIWPYKTHWLWGSACGIVDNIPVAFNIGYGFGDLSAHTENIIFYDGKAHKIDEVRFHHENRDPTKTWRFSSNDHRFEMRLKPLIPHTEKINFGVISLSSSLLHGLYSGTLVLDNGRELEITDMLGHAEDIYWHW